MQLKPLIVTLALAFAVAAVVFAWQPRYAGARAGRADENYVDSGKCVACHEDRHASWRRTYHSRMTQEATPETVLGDFSGAVFEYAGVKSQMERRGSDFFMSFTYADGRRETHKIARAVGSRRIQQYLTREAGQYTRLPVAYDLANRRWMSLNGSFFYPDGSDFNQHRTQWDSNCVFCHNVKAQPNMNLATRTCQTETAELGVACGACHAQAARHIEEASSPLARYRWRLGEPAPTDVVNPAKLDAVRSVMVCGHCHGQRVPQPIERIAEIMTKGDPYDAGENLADFYRPVAQDTHIGEFKFATRFWPNGSPRLTAYEYQGLLRSACFQRGETDNRISCLTCHSMHEGDPKGMLLDENRTDAPCVKCHRQYSPPDALAKHTGHPSVAGGSRCYNCHMPRVVYGVMSVHPTHEITMPDPTLTSSKGVPNACNQCHLDKSVNWATEQAKRLWPARFASVNLSPDKQFDEPEAIRALFAGDALTRAIMADALNSRGAAHLDKDWRGALLFEALNDNYPVVRFFAANGLQSLFPNHPKPDYLATPEARRATLNQWPALADEATRRHAAFFRARRVETDVEVGE